MSRRDGGWDQFAELGLEALSDEQLQSLRDVTASLLEERLSQRREAFVEEVKQRAAQLGVEVKELARALGDGSRAADGRSVVQPKYRDPGDPARTWSGRGAKPRWLRTLLDAGRQLEEFRVQVEPRRVR